MAVFAKALAEIVDRLLADDWCRVEMQEDGSVYYVVGLEAHDQHLVTR